jgi:hypothetical protein
MYAFWTKNRVFLTHLSYFYKCRLVFPLSAFECLNQSYEIWYAYHGTWAHLSGFMSWISFTSLCVCMCIALQLLSNGSVNTSRGKEELFKVFLSMRSVSYQRKVGDQFSPEILVSLWYFSLALLTIFVNQTVIKPITVAARSRAWTVFARLRHGCLCAFILCLCCSVCR